MFKGGFSTEPSSIPEGGLLPHTVSTKPPVTSRSHFRSWELWFPLLQNGQFQHQAPWLRALAGEQGQ